MSMTSRLRELEKSLKAKIMELKRFSRETEKSVQEESGKSSNAAYHARREAQGYEGALKKLYEIFPEIRDR